LEGGIIISHESLTVTCRTPSILLLLVATLDPALVRSSALPSHGGYRIIEARIESRK